MFFRRAERDSCPVEEREANPRCGIFQSVSGKAEWRNPPGRVFFSPFFFKTKAYPINELSGGFQRKPPLNNVTYSQCL